MPLLALDLPIATVKPLVASLLNLTVEHHGEAPFHTLLTFLGPSVNALAVESHWEILLLLSNRLIDPTDLRRNSTSEEEPRLIFSAEMQERCAVTRWIWLILSIVVEEGKYQ